MAPLDPLPRPRPGRPGNFALESVVAMLVLWAGVGIAAASPTDLPVPATTFALASLALGAIAAVIAPLLRLTIGARTAATQLRRLEDELAEGATPARIVYPGVRDRGDAIDVVEPHSPWLGRGARIAVTCVVAALVTIALAGARDSTPLLSVFVLLAGSAIASAWPHPPRAMLQVDGAEKRIARWADGALEFELRVGAVQGTAMRDAVEPSPEGPTRKRWVEITNGALGSPFRTAHHPAGHRPVDVRVPNLPEPVQRALGRRFAVLLAPRRS